ncbi:uncharacterized protein MYCGRDRAFT_88121 [Zymoseptoria tritici IPO323]|uniref:HNH domain-containing protein n=1 Tax=Zymoseptoria tritici (strain CBS 115943 / IPO323) TaxID=336722 RepID=F9XM53_ZYMTI|nr:uncharacterized protein MYCGRDRAFT_88121 [Zymoseptoria tritici IPO323]EGP83510.1 hypothetical protein MYCGRDRAFT_88121 [Zymoseptoria tritici IPO323]
MLPPSSSSNESSNFDTFRDCISTSIISALAPQGSGDSGKKTKKRVKGRKNEIKPVANLKTREEEEEETGRLVGEVGEFVEYIAEEIFLALPTELRTLSYAAIQSDSKLSEKYSSSFSTTDVELLTDAMPPSIADSLTTYTLLSSPSHLPTFLAPPIQSYISTTTSPPPTYTPSLLTSRPSSCEICSRDHLPLTYHHLIPRSVADKAVKRGWCEEWERGKVAWLCRACHSFVHGLCSNEELARSWGDVEALMGREDVRRWAGWVGRVRWKSR